MKATKAFIKGAGSIGIYSSSLRRLFIGNIYLEMITAKNSPRAIDIIVTIEAIKIELRIKP